MQNKQNYNSIDKLQQANGIKLYTILPQKWINKLNFNKVPTNTQQ